MTALNDAHNAMIKFQYGEQFDPDMDPVGWSEDQLAAGLEAAKGKLAAEEMRAFADQMQVGLDNDREELEEISPGVSDVIQAVLDNVRGWADRAENGV